MKEIVIEGIDVKDVVEYNKSKYNVNNLYIDDKPIDYDEKLMQTKTSRWFTIFLTSNNITNYSIIVLGVESWMFDALEIGAVSGKFPSLYQEELDDYCERYNIMFDDDYFVRTEHCSLKYGEYKTGPYNSLKNIIKSIISSTYSHSCLRPDDREIKLYLSPWIYDYDEDREFRVFVYNNNITAISSQNLYQENIWLKSHSNIKSIVESLLNFFYSTLSSKLHNINNGCYTMDIYYSKYDQWYFIECNGFGAEYSAGSSLFHWQTHHDILYDKSPILPLRYPVS